MAFDRPVFRSQNWQRTIFVGICSAFFSLASALPVRADDTALEKQIKAIDAQLKAQQTRLAAQEHALKAQQEAIAKQTAIIESQRKELARLNSHAATLQPAALPMDAPAMPLYQAAPGNSGVTHRTVTAQASPAPAPATAAPAPAISAPTSSAPTSPVGEAPKPEGPPQVVQSLPQGLAVLTPAGHFILTPSVEYTQTTNDRLVYEGVVIVPGINLGQVSASTDDRSIVSSVLDLRYGITDRLEAEVRVPFTFSDDRATVLVQNPNGSATQSVYASSSGLGDVEFGARYQINQGLDNWPVFVANARAKSDTGLGPFDIKRDTAGIAQQVALGSGFWSVEGGFSMLKVSDPAVLFASANYIYSVPKDINKTIGSVYVGHVDPSSSVNVNLGFGFAVNPDFSFSLGYEHSYVMPQTTMLGSTQQQTTALEVGAMTLGMAYRLGPNVSLNGNFEFGVTAAAPDMRAVFSVPLSF
jgi:hypothetical protein